MERRGKTNIRDPLGRTIETKGAMKLSIIIVSWNVCSFLKGCLTSLYAYPPAEDFEVFVVDNASKDGSHTMVKDSFPEVQLIENKENLGFARANNQGIKKSSGRYVLLLNPDTEVKPGSLESLVEFMDSHPEVGAAGSRYQNPDGSLQISCYPRPTLVREVWRLFHLDKFKQYAGYPVRSWDMETPRPVDTLQGASLILRRQTLDQVGLLDEDFFVYSEEVDLCYRIWKAGWGLYWVPQSQIIHFGGQSTQQESRKMFLQLYKSKLLYFRKHYGWGSVFIYKLILFAASFTRLLMVPIVWFEPPVKRQKHLTLAGNYFHLLFSLPGM